MRVALTSWQNRISPVLDTAQSFLLVDIDNAEIVASSSINLGSGSLLMKLDHLKKAGCSFLLCGAVSEFCRRQVVASGITLIPWLRGDVNTVLEAFVADGLGTDEFIMPGCRPRCRGRRRGWGRGRNRRS